MNTAELLVSLLRDFQQGNLALAAQRIQRLDPHSTACLAAGAVSMIDQLLDIHHPRPSDRDAVLQTMGAYAAQTMDTTS